MTCISMKEGCAVVYRCSGSGGVGAAGEGGWDNLLGRGRELGGGSGRELRSEALKVTVNKRKTR